MRADRIDIYHYCEPFSIRFHSPQAMRVRADSMLMAVSFDAGATGWGECVPRPYVTGETVESVSGILETIAAPLLLAADIRCLDDVRNLLGTLRSRCIAAGRVPFQCAEAIVDLALLDALSRNLGQDLGVLLSAPPRPKRIRRSLSVPFLPEATIRVLFPELKGRLGIDAAKVILGDDLEANVSRVALIRELGGEAMDLRVEANGKWTYARALAHIDALSGFHLCGVEQPLSPGDLPGLRRLRAEIGQPVVADESLCSLEDAKRLLEADACDVFNIKVSKCGGLLASMQMVALAEAAGKRCQIGTHVGETEILGGAAEFLAQNVVGGDLWFDVGSSLLLSKEPPADPPSKTGSDHGGEDVPTSARFRLAEKARPMASIRRPRA